LKKKKKFINTTNSIAKDLSITSSIEIRKSMFRMLLKILLSSKGKNILNINKLNVFVSVKMIPMNFLK